MLKSSVPYLRRPVECGNTQATPVACYRDASLLPTGTVMFKNVLATFLVSASYA